MNFYPVPNCIRLLAHLFGKESRSRREYYEKLMDGSIKEILYLGTTSNGKEIRAVNEVNPKFIAEIDSIRGTCIYLDFEELAIASGFNNSFLLKLVEILK
jgi:hypothetical protein